MTKVRVFIMIISYLVDRYQRAEIKNSLLCLLSLRYVIWNNILGETTGSNKIFKMQTGQLELSQEARREILAEIYLKT
jgi:hypothetical protein